jgi:two-component sensor histidine kinase
MGGVSSSVVERIASIRHAIRRKGALARALDFLERFKSSTFFILMMAYVLASLGGLGSILIWQNYQSVITAAERRALSSAQLVAAHVEWMVQASDQALRRIDDAIGNSPVGSAENSVADIYNAVGNLPEGYQYSVYDVTGRLRYSSIPNAIGIEVSDRSYFQQLSKGDLLAISPLLDERVSGKRVFIVARRIERNGRFHGVASIAIPADSLSGFWSHLAMGDNSTVAIVRTDGELVARHPSVTAAVNISASPLFREHLPVAQSGFYFNRGTSVDGRARTVGYQTVTGWPLIATTGIDRSEALEVFWRNLRDGLSIGLPMALLCLIGMLWGYRLLQADAQRRADLEQAVEQNRFLLREIHHRVKNNLQAVASLVRLQPIPEEQKEDISRRIRAMVAVHQQIYQTDKFTTVQLAPYVEELVEDVAAGFKSNVAIEMELDPVVTNPDQAMPLGFILTEIVTNAFKHAFAGRSEGKLSVRLFTENDTVNLVVEDDGPGHRADAQRGMGSKLLDGFVVQLGGTIESVSGDGTKVTVSFPRLA